MVDVFECAQCGAILHTMDTFREHMKATHVARRLEENQLPPSKQAEVDKARQTRAVVPPAPIVERPVKLEPEVKRPEPVVPPAIPITLEYIYKGQCPVCRSAPKTIMVSVKSDTVALAWCMSCDKKIAEQNVIPLDKQALKMMLEMNEKPTPDEEVKWPINRFRKK